MRHLLKCFLLLLVASSCMMEPKYEKPLAPVTLEPEDNKPAISAATWKQFFVSENMRSVIQTALDNNRDLKTAYLNMEAAIATYDISKADLVPKLTLTGTGVRRDGHQFMPKSTYTTSLDASFELDFFGKLRSAKKSSYEKYLATEEAKNVIRVSLITQTAVAYTQLLVDKHVLNLAKTNALEAKKLVDIFTQKVDDGSALRTDLLSAQNVYANAQLVEASYIRAVERDTNALMLLMGIFDKSLIPDGEIDKLKINEELVYFVPSEALLYRPDIKQSEHILKSSNADIGAARAAFFPSITLTGGYGFQSDKLDTLFSAKSWSVGPSISLPIFTAGKNFANLRLSKAKKQMQVLAYEKAIQTAFKEVLDASADRKSATESLKSYERLIKVSNESYKILKSQNEYGIVDTITTINTHLTLLGNMQGLYIRKQDYIVNLINLYKVLGGGSNVRDEQDSQEEIKVNQNNKNKW